MIHSSVVRTTVSVIVTSLREPSNMLRNQATAFEFLATRNQDWKIWKRSSHHHRRPRTRRQNETRCRLPHLRRQLPIIPQPTRHPLERFQKSRRLRQGRFRRRLPLQLHHLRSLRRRHQRTQTHLQPQRRKNHRTQKITTRNQHPDPLELRPNFWTIVQIFGLLVL